MSAASLIRQRGQSASAPLLERSGARLAIGLREMLCGMIGKDIDIAADGLSDMAMASWQIDAAVLAQFHFAVLKTPILVRWPLPLLGWLCDRFYGGAGAASEARGGASPAERRLAERLSRQLERPLAAAWAERQEQPHFVAIGGTPFRDSEALIVQSLRVAAGALPDQRIEIAYPAAALRGLPAEPAHESIAASDPAWAAQLRAAMMAVRLPVRSVLARPELSVARLLTLKPGDTIPLHIPVTVPLTVADRHFASGSIGEANGHAAIRIDQFQKGPRL
jgi:flagellar motor switch protein FliM